MNGPIPLVLGTVVVALLALIIMLSLRIRDARNTLVSETTTNERSQANLTNRVRLLESELQAAQAVVDRLRQYEGLADADARASVVLSDAEAAASVLRAQAQADLDAARAGATQIQAEARAEAGRIAADAAARARVATSEREAILAEARSRADAVIRDGERKAEDLAGDALRALQQAARLERTIEALRNTVEGYGDRYLIPRHTLTDSLAEETGHADVGQQLKGVRDEIRRAIREGRAASCDYVEANRRETAIRFVTDAFNGKVESVLARVRHDNAGTLLQEIQDGYTLVNHNGEAFRKARISEHYLALRLKELQLAATAHQLKLEEREEQRRVKEQLREEEKARRDFERALRETAREEEMLKKAMEKAQQQLAKASDEQRAKYEDQLVELRLRLVAAEEKSQRALSMAQQTKRGHVYVISNVGSFGAHVYKIGLTRRLDPLDRIRELGDSSVPFEFDVHALIFAEDAPALEYQLHRHFALRQVNKVNYRKEFFRVDIAQIRQEIESLGLVAQWTMTALAREHHESLAIERLISSDPKAHEAWMRRQLDYEAVFAPEEEASIDADAA